MWNILRLFFKTINSVSSCVLAEKERDAGFDDEWMTSIWQNWRMTQDKTLSIRSQGPRTSWCNLFNLLDKICQQYPVLDKTSNYARFVSSFVPKDWLVSGAGRWPSNCLFFRLRLEGIWPARTGSPLAKYVAPCGVNRMLDWRRVSRTANLESTVGFGTNRGGGYDTK